MEAFTNFSIIKQKIIKTDEVLRMYKEKIAESAKLRKSIEFKNAEINKLTMENGRLSYNNNNYEDLLTEHTTLKKESVRLEREYHSTINSLQIKLQTVSQELEDKTRRVQNSPKPEKNTSSEFKELKELYKKLKIDFEDLQLKYALVNAELSRPKENESVKVEQENSKLKEKIAILNKQKSCQELENCEMKKRLNDLKCLEVDSIKLTKSKEELEATRKQLEEATTRRQENYVKLATLHAEIAAFKANNFKLVRQNEQLKNQIFNMNNNEEIIEDLKQQLETAKTYAATLIQNNEILVGKLSEFKEENFELQNKLRSCATSPTDAYVQQICEEMRPLDLITPVNDFSSENLALQQPIAPVITVTLPTPASLIHKKQFTSSGSFLISDDLDVVKQRVKKRVKKMKKKKKKVDLLAALHALQKANINFTISNTDIVLPSHLYRNSYSCRDSCLSSCDSRVISAPKQESKHVFKELSCSNNCGNGKSFMILENNDEDSALLGFLDIKSESCTTHESETTVNNGTKNIEKTIFHNSKCTPSNLEFAQRLLFKSLVNVESTAQSPSSTMAMSASPKKSDSVVPTSPEVFSGSVQSASTAQKRPSTTQLKSLTVPEKLRILEKKLETSPQGLSSPDANMSRFSHQTLPFEADDSEPENFENTPDMDESAALSMYPKSSEILLDQAHQVAERRKSPRIAKPTRDCQMSKNLSVKKGNDSPTSSNELNDVVTTKKRIAHTRNELQNKSSEISTNIVKLKPIKTSPRKNMFKKPVCNTRRSARLLSLPLPDKIEQNLVLEPSFSDVRTEIVFPTPTFDEIEAEEEVQNTNSELCESEADSRSRSPPIFEESDCPQSPPPVECYSASVPKIIPLEKVEKMASSKVKVLLEKLINYSREEKALDEVVDEFSTQNPMYIAEVILERISTDYHDKPDNKHGPPQAPLLTETQRVMLGFMSKLEKNSVGTVFDEFLRLAERKLLTCKVLEPIGPITRLYLAICKLRKDLHRMRILCCDVFYFCDDLALPFFHIVLTSWTEVLPNEIESQDFPLAKVLVQIIHLKNCNQPGYNSMVLRDLLGKFYGYPMERWNSDELFEELFREYQRNPVRSSDFALLLFCKHHPEKWVYDKIQQCFIPMIDKITSDNFKAAVIILVSNLSHRFSKKSEFLRDIQEWLRSLIGGTTPDVIKRSVYLCLKRLAKIK